MPSVLIFLDIFYQITDFWNNIFNHLINNCFYSSNPYYNFFSLSAFMLFMMYNFFQKKLWRHFWFSQACRSLSVQFISYRQPVDNKFVNFLD